MSDSYMQDNLNSLRSNLIILRPHLDKLREIVSFGLANKIIDSENIKISHDDLQKIEFKLSQLERFCEVLDDSWFNNDDDEGLIDLGYRCVAFDKEMLRLLTIELVDEIELLLSTSVKG